MMAKLRWVRLLHKCPKTFIAHAFDLKLANNNHTGIFDVLLTQTVLVTAKNASALPLLSQIRAECRMCGMSNLGPLLSHVKRPVFLGVSQDLAVSQTGYITNEEMIQTSRHILKVCVSVTKGRRNLFYSGYVILFTARNFVEIKL